MNRNLCAPPFQIDAQDSLPKLFRHRCQQYDSKTAHREKQLGLWQAFSWSHFYNQARAIGLGLKQLGLQNGEVVSILSQNRKEWIYADMAIQCVGAISTGIYPTDSPPNIAAQLLDANSRFLFVEDGEQLDKINAIAGTLPQQPHIIVFDPDGLELQDSGQIMALEQLTALGANQPSDNFEAMIDASAPDDTAMLVYTSGTTGNPRGAMISHANIMYTLCAAAHSVPTRADDEQLCFLPLCHILERLISVFLPIGYGATVNFAEDQKSLFDNLAQVSPHTFTAVPRIWEKIHAGLIIRAEQATPLGRWAWKRAVASAHKQQRSALLRLEYRLWNATILARTRRRLGLGRLRRAISGAAPIAPELLDWFHVLGVPLNEGYGMTETTGVISINPPDDNRYGTVGLVQRGARLRIADDGEIQYSGPNVFGGYWNNPDETKAALTKDGWLRTGDLGKLDQDNYLTITGRKKALIITAGGKNIAPEKIENLIKASPLVSDCLAIGDQRRFVSALILLDQDMTEQFARQNNISFSGFADLTRKPVIIAKVNAIIDHANQQLNPVEQVKAHRLLDIQLDAEDEELTATMKLRRDVILKRHAKLIDQIYQQTKQA